MVLKKKLNSIIFSSFILLLSMQAFAISSAAMDKKLDKIIKKDLSLTDFEKSSLNISNEQLENAGIELFGHQLFKLESKDGFNGFYIVESAMGRFHDFTYVIFFEMDLSVKLVRVVEYGEDHGAEITNSRWLRQFVGKTPVDHLMFKKNIDAISGATISGQSITESINVMLQNVKLLRENKFI
jgi:Na+-translocating ferredoxin:NAD+ oxidoreductase RnfG subunit